MNKFISIGILALALPMQAQDSGAYLALRQAFYDSDDTRVREYLDIELARDSENPVLLEEAVLSSVYNLDLDLAIGYADKLRELKPNSMAVEAVTFADLLKRNQFYEAAEYLKSAETLKFLSPEIIEAWGMSEDGKPDEAIQYLKDVADAQGELAFIFDFQRAMIEANANQNYEAAIDIIANKGEALYLSDLSYFSHIAMLKLSGSPVFDSFMKGSFGEKELWPGYIKRLVASAEAGKIDPSLDFASPQNAIGEYIAAILAPTQDQTLEYGVERLLHGIPPSIVPENAAFLTTYMNYFQRRGEYEDVVIFADRVKKDSFLKRPTEQTKVNALFALNRNDHIRDWIKDVKPEGPDEMSFIGDAHRRLEEYPEAIAKFEESLAVTGEDDEKNVWTVYGLAIAYERTGQWDKAEPKFLKAIELDPENPSILNYLGYSYVDRGEKLDEGLKMIEKAVEISPYEGHIIDSLGWAYFRLGRYQDAIEPLENAASLMSTDAIVNAHLGDLYWRVGREREARYQWERAKRFLEQDTQDLTHAELEERIEVGLNE